MFIPRKKSIQLTIIFVIFTILFILLEKIFYIRFQENDDPIMLLIVSGKYTGNTDSHLVFINFIYGKFLNILYDILPNIEWYTLTLVVLNIISLSFITYIIKNSSLNSPFKFLIYSFIFSIFLYLTVELQFTKTAAICATTGLYLIYKKKNKYIASILIIIGSLIRFEASVLIILISLPFFLSQTINIKSIKSNLNLHLLFFTLLIVSFLKVLDYVYYYQEPDWKNYLLYNKIRGKINDNPNAIDVASISNDISTQDYELLLMFTPNPDVIELNEIKIIYEAIDQKSFLEKISNITFFSSYYKWLILLITISILSGNGKKLEVFQNIFAIFIFISLFSYLSMDLTVKGRVFFPALICVILFLISLETRKLNFSNTILFGSILLITLMFIRTSIIDLKANEKLIVSAKDQFNFIDDYISKDKKLIPFRATYRIEHNNPFKISTSYPTGKVFISGWMTKNPLHKNNFESFRCFVNGDFGLLVETQETEEIVNLISSSILENYKIKTKSQIVVERKGYSIVEFCKIN